MMICVIRNPDITKNISTPIKPPGKVEGKEWDINTDIIAMALIPSISVLRYEKTWWN